MLVLSMEYIFWPGTNFIFRHLAPPKKILFVSPWTHKFNSGSGKKNREGLGKETFTWASREKKKEYHWDRQIQEGGEDPFPFSCLLDAKKDQIGVAFPFVCYCFLHNIREGKTGKPAFVRALKSHFVKVWGKFSLPHSEKDRFLSDAFMGTFVLFPYVIPRESS